MWKFALLLQCSHFALHGIIQVERTSDLLQVQLSLMASLSLLVESIVIERVKCRAERLKEGSEFVFLIPVSILPVLDKREMLPFFIIRALCDWFLK